MLMNALSRMGCVVSFASIPKDHINANVLKDIPCVREISHVQLMVRVIFSSFFVIDVKKLYIDF